MASLTIDGVGTELQRKLSALAAEHGSTVPQEALRVMADALHVSAADRVEEPVMSEPAELQTGAHLFFQLRALVEKYGPFDLEIPPRTPSDRKIPDFSQWPD